MKYSKAYWDNYYDGTYETTYAQGFPIERILDDWHDQYDEPPISFADIGCGLGHTLAKARTLLPDVKLIYGVEAQNIPDDRIASDGIIFGDFLDLYHQLPAVDLLYVACSMYIPWEKQEEFIAAAMSLAKKAVVFSNVYLTDRDGIPQDILRTTIYNSRSIFDDIMKTFDFVPKGMLYVPA